LAHFFGAENTSKQETIVGLAGVQQTNWAYDYVGAGKALKEALRLDYPALARRNEVRAKADHSNG